MAINNSVDAGVTYVFAAGNAGEDASFRSSASNPNAISVAAMADSDRKCGGLGPQTAYGPDDTLASFSSFSDKVVMAAPGMNIYIRPIWEALYHSLHPGVMPSQVRSALLSTGRLPLEIEMGKDISVTHTVLNRCSMGVV